MNAPIVDIHGADDFGIWYMDRQDEPQKYGQDRPVLGQACQTNRAGKTALCPAVLQ